MPMFHNSHCRYGTGDAPFGTDCCNRAALNGSPKLRRKAADQVAKQVEAIRASAKLSAHSSGVNLPGRA